MELQACKFKTNGSIEGRIDVTVIVKSCKFKTNGSTEGRIDVTVIVKSCKPASSKQRAIKDVSI